MSTWGDLKLAVLQKMFAADDVIVKDDSTLGYIAAMPHCANEGLAMLATAGKFITKSVKIAQKNIENIVAESVYDKITEFTDSFSYQTDEGQSYYFECSGVGTCNIYVDDDLFTTIEIEDINSYAIFKGLITNPDKKTVRFEFTTLYPMGVKNFAIYRETFPTEEDVVPFTEKIKYPMKELAPDFYMIDPQGIYYEGTYHQYLQISDFFQEGTNVLVLDRDRVGSYTVYYRAYPEQLTKDTEDDYELPIDPEVYALLPLYMASQLYKDDDQGIATSYRNELEVGFERLVNSANLSAYEVFTSESGWV